MSEMSFAERVLSKKRKGEANRDTQREAARKLAKKQFRKRVLMPIGIVVAVFIAVIAVLTSLTIQASQSSQHSVASQHDSWGVSDSQVDTYATPLVVHLDDNNKIDKTYTAKELKKLSKQELAADNVVSFALDADWGPSGQGLNVPMSVTVDGVSYPFTTQLGIYVDPLETPVQTYNAQVAIDPSISLRGQKNLFSLPQYILSKVAARLSDALKKGTITAPVASYTGTGTEYHNDDVATAYKAGINPNVFNTQCNQSSNTQNNPCSIGTAKYDFGCKTVGVAYPNLDEFTAQVAQVLQLKYGHISTPRQGDVQLNTTAPCRIVLDQGNPVQTNHDNGPYDGPDAYDGF